MQRLIRRLSFIALSVLVILLIGTAGFILIEDFPPFDAFYMSLTTIATVGYAEIRPLGLRGRIFNTFLILVGVTTILVAIGAITQSVIEIEIGEILGRRRNKRMIDKLEGHFVICGYGRVGRGAAAELSRAGVPYTTNTSNVFLPRRFHAATGVSCRTVDRSAVRIAVMVLRPETVS